MSFRSHPPLNPAAAPEWLRGVTHTPPADPNRVNPVLDRRAPDGAAVRPAAVLVLFGGSPESDPLAVGGLPADADVLLTQRASTMRQHSGQVAFPGGAADPEDDGPVDTALREAEEETGLERSGVQPLVTLPQLFIPPSGFDVTPVLAYWRDPSPVGVVDVAEAERVVRVPVRDLIDPDNRFQVRHRAGYQARRSRWTNARVGFHRRRARGTVRGVRLGDRVGPPRRPVTSTRRSPGSRPGWTTTTETLGHQARKGER